MHPRSAAQLHEIKERCRRIQRSVAGMGLADYLADPETQTNIERHLEVIGEAINRLARVDAATATLITDWELIVGLRNVIAHGYDVLDQRRIFVAVQTKVPQLAREVEELLQESRHAIDEQSEP